MSGLLSSRRKIANGKDAIKLQLAMAACQSISKQRDEYIVTIENNFSFFENERPAIHNLRSECSESHLMDSWTLVFKEREVVLYSYYVFVTLLRDRLFSLRMAVAINQRGNSRIPVGLTDVPT